MQKWVCEKPSYKSQQNAETMLAEAQYKISSCWQKQWGGVQNKQTETLMWGHWNAKYTENKWVETNSLGQNN